MESKLLVETLGSSLLSLVNIDNLPSLVSTVVSLVNNDWLTFSIFSTTDVEAFSVLPVDNMFILVFEDLPPLRVGAPDLHVVGSTRVLDIPRLVVISSSDSQRLLVEVPDLGSSTVWSLDDHVSVVDQVKVSLAS